MKISGHIILFTLVVLTSLLVAFFGVHVILSVAALYSLSFITQFNFTQIYGFWVIFGIFKYKYQEPSKKDEDFPYKNIFTKMFNTAFYYLIAWGMAFLIFYILK